MKTFNLFLTGTNPKAITLAEAEHQGFRVVGGFGR